LLSSPIAFATSPGRNGLPAFFIAFNTFFSIILRLWIKS
jgi:hypothetical protein